ncbi:ABC transporter ATP-binding protein [Candidatus Aerophobetes bacterium]|uniref:ABC transporter ATP-binding protein n=2 Tax=root TaxID=1 RepID=A0A523Y0W7_UNCAE|nr:MAG: ABC transporter ATP-binding protein [Candidatus Aerophobetes bacterium]
MLTIRNLKSYYGRMQALKGVSLHVEEGEVVSLIGANGAGKTTLLNSIVGLVSSRTGQILFSDTDIIQRNPRQIIRMGVSLVPEGRQLFAPLTVIENLILGAYQRYRKDKKSEIKSDLEKVFVLFPILKERKSQIAGTLSGGEQQMLAIGRSLMAKPKLILMDEPSMGLAPLVTTQIFQIISELHKQGTTILLVEQNAEAALRISSRAYVIETGRVVLQGMSQELLHNQEVRRAYLGREYKEVWE